MKKKLAINDQAVQHAVAATRSQIKTSIDEHFLTKKKLAKICNVSPRTIDGWIAAKRIPFHRLSGRMVRFNLERVLAALDRYEVKEAGRRIA